MKMSLGLIVLGSFALILGCSYQLDTPMTKNPLSVKATVPLAVPILGGNASMVIEGNLLLIPESAANQLTAVNLDTFKVLWRTALPFSPRTNPIVLNGEVFVFAWNEPKIMVVKLTGEVDKCITIASADPGTPLQRMYEITKSQSALLWVGWNTNNNHGLWRLDPVADVQNGIGVPKRLWSNKLFDATVPYYQNGNVYWGYEGQDATTDYLSNPKDNHFMSISEATGQINWEVTTEKSRILSPMQPIIYQNSLIINTWTGIFGITLDGVITKEYNNTPWGLGLALNGNVAYLSRGNTPPNNIVALNLDTGNILWDQFYEGTLGTAPAYRNGIVYQETQGDLRLYRASDGAYLGIDRSIPGDPGQSTATWVYKNYYIVKSFDRVSIIDMDFKLDGKGNLTR